MDETGEVRPRGRLGRRQADTAWSEEVAEAILERIAGGESMRSVCRDPAMPALQTVCRWVREKYEFREALEAARDEAGRPYRPAGVSTFCEETANAILTRLAAGEGAIAICRDPDMPAISTFWKWKDERPEFAKAVAMAREIQGEVFAERGWAICEEATPETAFLAKVKLGHLRWHAGKLAPKDWGAHKAAEAPGTALAAPKAAKWDGSRITHVYIKNYVTRREGEAPGWSQEPARHLYTTRMEKDGTCENIPVELEDLREPRGTGYGAVHAEREGVEEGED